VSAFKAAGVNIWGVTVQNEPQPQTGTLTYEGMFFDFAAELEFVAEYLGPRLAADHPDVKLLIFDHNQADAYLYAAPILADPVASQYVDGTAFHWYSGPDWSAIDALHTDFPDKLLLASEATAARGTDATWFASPDWSTGEYYGNFIINDLLSHSIGFLDWNILLDGRGGPSHADPTGEQCEGLIPCGSAAMLIVDATAKPPVLYKQAFYWYMGHVSRFVPPGAVRVGTNSTRTGGDGAGGPSPVLAVAFAVAGGAGANATTTALVLMNPLDSAEPVTVTDARYGSLSVLLPPHSIQTWVY
jgi:glucosylceramidase